MVVLDYGSGNVHSVVKAVAAAGAEVELTSDRSKALDAAGLIVPGVGAFTAVMNQLNEVRGAELITLLQAINTGHASGATIHANSFDDVLPRVNAIGRGAGLDAQSMLEQMRSAFTWLIHVDHRKVVKIAKFD